MAHPESRLGPERAGSFRGELFAAKEQSLVFGSGLVGGGRLGKSREAEGIDGLVLGGTVSEIFPGLQTLFFPAYPASEQRLQIAETKVFPEPIDGEGLLRAIARAEDASADAPDLFHVVDVLQMCCLSRRGGAVQIVKGTKSGIVFLRAGQIANAETAAAQGQAALLETLGWGFIEFAYDPTVRAPAETITIPWDAALVEGVKLDKGIKVAQHMHQKGMRA